MNRIGYVLIALVLTAESAAGQTDITPPVITGVAVSEITSSGATITWTTDEPSDSQVEYGLTPAYGSVAPLDPSLVTAHAQTTRRLAADRRYWYRVKSRDAAGNLAMSASSFRTADATSAPPPPPPPPPAVTATDPGVRPGNTGNGVGGDLGGVIDGVTAGEGQVWFDGLSLFFGQEFTVPEGLGPRFNFVVCAGCHPAPAIGGSSGPVNPQATVHQQFPGNTRQFSFIKADGPVREARVVRRPDGTPDGGVHQLFVITGGPGAEGCYIAQEDLDAQLAMGNLIFRIPTPFFGAGLIENIPDAVILANAAAQAYDKQALGITGRPNRNGNDGTIARFGWKAQNKSLELFAGEAMNVELGVTNDLFPTEVNETPSCQFRTVSNDFEPVDGVMPFVRDRQTQLRSAWRHMTFTMRFHRQPQPTTADFVTERGITVTAYSTTDGRAVFDRVGCALCHTPELRSHAQAQSAALREKPVRLFSDLLLHNMGQGLADGVQQGEAGPDEFRSSPLWNVGQRRFFLHDGRTDDMVQAILEHESSGSEANAVIRQFRGLSPKEQQDLVNFLRSL